MARVLYTESAQSDLLEAWLYIAEESPVAADRVLDKIEQEADGLSSRPLMGRARPELGTEVRAWPTSTPYILFYRADDLGIVVLRVFHHARDVQRIAF